MSLLSNIAGILIDLFLILKYKFLGFTVRKTPNEWQSGKKTAILIPGVHSSWNCLRLVANVANKNGYKILTLKKLGNNSKPLAKGANILDQFLTSNKIKDAVIICHSKGGLVAKFYLDKIEKTKRVCKVITISTPYHGSWMALVLAISELLPTSKTINDLNRHKENNHKFVCFYPRLDNIIIPNKGLILNGARNIKIDTVGHTRILESKKTLEKIEEVVSS